MIREQIVTVREEYPISGGFGDSAVSYAAQTAVFAHVDISHLIEFLRIFPANLARIVCRAVVDEKQFGLVCKLLYGTFDICSQQAFLDIVYRCSYTKSDRHMYVVAFFVLDDRNLLFNNTPILYIIADLIIKIKRYFTILKKYIKLYIKKYKKAAY